MSRPSGVSPRPPAPSAGGGGGVPTLGGSGGGGRAKGLKDVRIDEEVKIAVSIALERFRYGDERGKKGTPPAASPPLSPDTRGRGCLRGRGEDLGRPAGPLEPASEAGWALGRGC